ncbi:hypothetical protein AB9F26_05955 [Falsihalocynthiibacter sp. BN13B15]|uniref:hypothetical protein n=1 Tax=Falsihalocynthiibacter sp. BN13B15 TaxID=3240871 RepID=UPI00350FCC39
MGVEKTVLHHAKSYQKSALMLAIPTTIFLIYLLIYTAWDIESKASTRNLNSKDIRSNLENEQFSRSLGIYYRCSLLSESNVLTVSEVQFCMTHYMNVKLSFVDEMDISKFDQLPTKEKAIVNSRSYQSFKQWEFANPLIVNQSKENSEQLKLLLGLNQ